MKVALRVAVTNIATTRAELETLGARFIARYECRDLIYAPGKGTGDLTDDFVRIRLTPGEKGETIGIIRKQTRFHGDAKEEQVVFSEDCATMEEATATVARVFGGDFAHAFAFRRQGAHYQVRSCAAFLEEIQHLPPSLEIIAESQSDLGEVVCLLGVTERLAASVPELVRRALVRNT